MTCLSVVYECPAAFLQFVAEDAGDAGAVSRPLIGQDFGALAIAPEPMLLSLLVTYV